MKLLLAILALASFGIAVPNMYADDLILNLGAIGQGTVDLGPVQAGTGVVTLDKNYLGILNQNGVASDVNLNFTAAFVGLGATLPAGVIWQPGAVDALVVTESCVAVDVLSNAKNPCTGLSFAYTNANVGNILDVVGGVNIGADVDADVLGANAGLGIGAGTETIQFGNPPSATPEPGTLSLMGTGLLGVAGLLRRKLRGQA